MIYLPKDNMFIRVMLKDFLKWWRLIISPARNNECLAWNCHGLGNLRIGKELVEIIRAKDLFVVFLAETLIDEARLDTVQRNIEFNHRWVVQREG